MTEEKNKQRHLVPVGAALVTLAAAAALIWYFGRRERWHWGDVPTWVGAVSTVTALGAAGVGAYFAYRQLGALRDQVDMQSTALELQKEQAEADRADAKKREDRELEIRAAELRHQADLVDIRPEQRDFKPQGVNQDVFLALHVENNSSRPIRNVNCRAFINGNMTLSYEVANFVKTAGGPTAAVDRSQYIPIPTMRRNTQIDFVFNLVADLNHGATYLLRFTDDAGLHWELTDDMHLTSIPDRTDW